MTIDAPPQKSRWPHAADRDRIGTLLAGRWPQPALTADDGDALLLAAAIRAGVVYPGPIAALIRREIRAYLEFGSRFGGGAQVRSVAEVVLGMPYPDDVPRPAA